MNFDDFQDQFQDVTVATIGPDFNQDGLSGKCLIFLMVVGKRDFKKIVF